MGKQRGQGTGKSSSSSKGNTIAGYSKEISNLFGTTAKGTKITDIKTLANNLATAVDQIKQGFEKDNIYKTMIDMMEKSGLTKEQADATLQEIITKFGLDARTTTDQQPSQAPDHSQDTKTSNSKKSQEAPQKKQLTAKEKFLRGEDYLGGLERDAVATAMTNAEIARGLASDIKKMWSWGSRNGAKGIVLATIGTVGDTAIKGSGIALRTIGGAVTMTGRTLFAIKGTADRYRENREQTELRKNVKYLTDATPQLVEMLDKNSNEHNVPDIDALTPEDKKVIEEVRNASKSKEIGVIESAYDTLAERSGNEVAEIRKVLEEIEQRRRESQMESIKSRLSALTVDDGKPRFSEAQIDSLLANTRVQHVKVKQPDGTFKVSRDIKYPAFSGVTQATFALAAIGMDELLEVLDAPIVKNLTDEQVLNLAKAVKIDSASKTVTFNPDAEMIYADDAGDKKVTLKDDETLSKFIKKDDNGSQVPFATVSMELIDEATKLPKMLEEHSKTELMQIEVAARFKYQLALNFQERVVKLNERVKALRSKAQSQDLSRQEQSDYKALRRIADEIVDKCKAQGLAETITEGNNQYLQFNAKAKSLLGEPAKAVEPFRNISQHKNHRIDELTDDSRV